MWYVGRRQGVRLRCRSTHGASRQRVRDRFAGLGSGHGGGLVRSLGRRSARVAQHVETVRVVVDDAGVGVVVGSDGDRHCMPAKQQRSSCEQKQIMLTN